MQDNKLKERIDSLDTLSVGVVFGKEDAWDKLQGRLDAKPERKLLPVYWWAAAAILLLVLGVAVVFKQSTIDSRLPIVNVTKVTGLQPVTERPETSNIPATEITHTTAPVPSPGTTNETPATMKTTTIATITAAPHLHPDELAPMPVVHDSQPMIAMPVVANIPVPVVVLKQPMKVVHINELNNDGYSTRTATAAIGTTSESTTAGQMQVVHLNSVLRDERRQYYNIQEAKVPNNVFTFMKTSHQYNFTTNDDLLTQASVKIKLRN